MEHVHHFTLANLAYFPEKTKYYQQKKEKKR